MYQIAKIVLGCISFGVPPEVVVAVLTTSTKKKLSELFLSSSKRFLEAFDAHKEHPTSKSKKRMEKEKSLLDLIRFRQKLVGTKKWSQKKIFKSMDDSYRPGLLKLVKKAA